jgi:antitoxin YefM
MTTVTLNTATQKLADLAAKVWDDRSPVVIATEDNRPVVLMSLEDYESLDETQYLLGHPANAERLLKAKVQLDQSQGVEHAINLDE